MIMSYNKNGVFKPSPDVTRRYELTCGHIYVNTQILPAGLQLICKGTTGGYAGAHGAQIARKLRNAR
jgi:hypothetical protein